MLPKRRAWLLEHEGATVKQDPFHLINRFTSKVGDVIKKKWLATEVSNALNEKPSQELRPAEEMSPLVQNVCTKIQPNDVTNYKEWLGTVENNLKIIEDGFLYIDSNAYMENGIKRQIISTSQLG
jgi:hypothetical protein